MNIISLLLIAGIAVLIVVFFIALKIFKSVIKTIMTVLLLLIIVLGIAGFIIYKDAVTLAEKIDGPKTILLMKDGVVKAGMSLPTTSSTDQQILDSAIKKYGENELSNIQLKLENNNFEYEGVLIIFEYDYFENSTLVLNTENIIMNKQRLEMIFEAKNMTEAVYALKEEQSEQELAYTVSLLERNFATVQEFKNWVFIGLVGKKSMEAKGNFIFKGISTDKVIIYPEFISVKVMKMFNADFFRNINAQVVKEVQNGNFR